MSDIRIKRFFFIVLFVLSGTVLLAQKQAVKVIYIGDSITAGAGLSDPATQAPPVIASAYLQKLMGGDTVIFSNQGHSGFTTVDFLPAGNAFKQVQQAASAFADKPGLLIFSIMLGTNDSAIKGTNGGPVAPAVYRENLKTIIEKLLKDYPDCKIIIEHPIWYSPNTYNGAQYLQEGLNRLQSYFPEIKRLVDIYDQSNKNQVFLGDTRAFNYFRDHFLHNFQAEIGHRGTFYLHPNKDGAVQLGQFWAEAIYIAIRRQ